jgi:hypothetical protein
MVSFSGDSSVESRWAYMLLESHRVLFLYDKVGIAKIRKARLVLLGIVDRFECRLEGKRRRYQRGRHLRNLDCRPQTRAVR